MTSPSSTTVLEITQLTRRFGDVVANHRVDLQVRAGDVVGLLGHNGAGKTTLVSQLVGLLAPDAGSIRVAGTDAVADPAAARRAVGLQAQGQAPLDGLTPRTAIELSARLRGASRRDAARATEALAAELDLGEWLDRRATPDGGGISGGVRRLTAFAMAVVVPMPLIVLDEPTNDVDAGRRRRLWEVVRRLGDAGSGVLLVTHNVVEAERVVDELVVLDRGRVVAAGTPAQVRGDNDDALRLELSLPAHADPRSLLERCPVAVRREVQLGRRLLLTIDPHDAEAAVAWASALRHADEVEDYALAPATLEDAYLAATAATAATATTDPATTALIGAAR
ncbi:ABC transporter ATP-binding protein [Nitriliruptoraceae bacterium ZYF776]|nr:ABC transporter ATP-binding protein [Profundirhabdus halotolerans]